MTPADIPRLRRKLNYHMAQYEQWQEQVADLEEQARVASTAHQRPVGGRVLPPEYISKSLLEGSFVYRRATGSRDAHMRASQMYAATLAVAQQTVSAASPLPVQRRTP